MTSKLIHKDQVRIGDAILYDGLFRTVCSKDIKHSHLTGRSIFGDCFRLGVQKVEVLSPPLLTTVPFLPSVLRWII